MVVFHGLFQIHVIFMIKVGNTGILLEIVVIANSVTVQDFDQSIKRVKSHRFSNEQLIFITVSKCLKLQVCKYVAKKKSMKKKILFRHVPSLLLAPQLDE